MVRCRRISPVAAWMMRTSKSAMSRTMRVPVWARPMAMWCRSPSMRRVTEPPLATAVMTDAEVGVAVAVARSCFGTGGVGGCGGAGVGQGAVRSLVVVDVDEAVEQGLELGDRGGLVGLGAQPRLEGLLEAFDLAAGGGVVRSRVLLDDAEAAEFGLEAVAAALAARQSGGEHHRVVGERRRRRAVPAHSPTEGGHDDDARDAQVSCDRHGVA